MTQDPTRIRATLALLREQLGNSEEVSPALRTSLLETVSNIESALADVDSNKRPPAPPANDSLASRLSEAALEFEDSHPTLAKTIGGLVNGLSNLGI